MARIQGVPGLRRALFEAKRGLRSQMMAHITKQQTLQSAFLLAKMHFAGLDVPAIAFITSPGWVGGWHVL